LDAPSANEAALAVLSNNVLSHSFFGNQTALNVSDLAKGMYIISIQNKGKRLVRKFVKE
jgi:Secretion system C-terminal sorting domain